QAAGYQGRRGPTRDRVPRSPTGCDATRRNHRSNGANPYTIRRRAQVSDLSTSWGGANEVTRRDDGDGVATPHSATAASWGESAEIAYNKILDLLLHGEAPPGGRLRE